jgi:chromosomal replication initiator protein
MSDIRIQTTFRVDPELLKRFRHALLERETKMTPVIEKMIREWLQGYRYAPNPWERILERLQEKVDPTSYETWLKPTRYSHSEEGVLFVRVPTAEFRHAGDKYARLIQEAIDGTGLEIKDVKFVTPEPAAAPPLQPQEGEASTVRVSDQSAQLKIDLGKMGDLNPRFTFDNFVVGSGNQFAHAACQAVAERPSKAYNPLFLYGGVGMGKTHLIQAIGHEIKRRQPQALVCYVSSEKFTNEMINSLRYDKMTSFRNKFRNVDALLIDDVQFLTGKERTQEEFFHTFNALHESMKQIVIASDRSPKELAEIENRLRSRFEWGLIADIQPPDLETKVAILQRWAENEDVKLPTDVALYIASSIRSNVRELEGGLIRLVAHSSLVGAEITLPYAQVVLRNFIESETRTVTIELIQKAVAEQFGLRLPEIKSKDNSRAIVYPRQIAMYLAKELTDASMSEIGRQFGGKHATTVLHSVEKIEELRKHDKDLNKLLNKVSDYLKG